MDYILKIKILFIFSFSNSYNKRVPLGDITPSSDKKKIKK